MVHGESHPEFLTPKSNIFWNKITVKENQKDHSKESLLSSFYLSFHKFLSVKHEPDAVLEAGNTLGNIRKMAKNISHVSHVFRSRQSRSLDLLGKIMGRLWLKEHGISSQTKLNLNTDSATTKLYEHGAPRFFPIYKVKMIIQHLIGLF